MFENKDVTTIDTLGEFGLIRHLAKSISVKNPETKLGIGDDAAAVDMYNQLTLISTDMLVEGIHFDLSYVPLKHLGYKAVIVNLSDIYAMNGTPKQITVSIALSSKFTIDAVEEFYSGMQLACERHQVDIVGGDTTSSLRGMTISITVIGSVSPGKMVKRSTASINDLICVSGDLGSAYLGLQILRREKEVFLQNPKAQPDLKNYEYLIERQLKPEARKDIIQKLSEVGVVPSSMIDISDGLASELMHICTSSKKGCRIYEDKVPVDMQAGEVSEEFNLSPVICALNGGEDYELLFTISPSDYEKVKELKDISIIGHITDESSGAFMVGSSGSEMEITAQGWDALKRN